MPIDSLRISGSALTAQRVRLDAISENIANAQTTRGPDGRAYRRKMVVFEAEVTYTLSSGTNVTIPYVDVLRLDGEFVYDYRIYIDLTPLEQALTQ